MSCKTCKYIVPREFPGDDVRLDDCCEEYRKDHRRDWRQNFRARFEKTV